jgi:hypothetical protein
MITTSDPELAERISMLRDHGSRKKYHYDLLGMNSRLDSLQAAILLVKFKHLESMTQARRRNADRYRRLFEKAGLEKVVALPVQPANCTSRRFVIRAAAGPLQSSACGLPPRFTILFPFICSRPLLVWVIAPAYFREEASRQVRSLPVFK